MDEAEFAYFEVVSVDLVHVEVVAGGRQLLVQVDHSMRIAVHFDQNLTGKSFLLLQNFR